MKKDKDYKSNSSEQDEGAQGALFKGKPKTKEKLAVLVNPTLLSSKNIRNFFDPTKFEGNRFSFPEVEVLANLDFADELDNEMLEENSSCSYFEDQA